MKTGYIWDSAFLGHDTSAYHPENPLRLKELDYSAVSSDLLGLIKIDNRESFGRPSALKVHTQGYLERFKKESNNGRPWLDSFDTKLRKDTYEVALRSVSAAISLTDAVCAGKIDNGFAAIRPPGHHATFEKAKGFCFFNNIAICARYVQQLYDFKKVLIVDWDVHPGDGTTNIFYQDSSVHVLSIHQEGIFGAAVGNSDQRGQGEGQGATYNVSLPERSRLVDYMRSFEPALHNAVERCQPDIIFISCGFDAHRGDPLGNMDLGEDAFQRFTTLLKQAAKKHCGGRLVSLLEGGYNVNILPACVRSHLEILMD